TSTPTAAATDAVTSTGENADDTATLLGVLLIAGSGVVMFICRRRRAHN
ncbi:MAG: LPXTG cell wall anchor domain-containing protein, partial [Clostridiales bacterium]|nr:LPXTG cell wall anchor domain-containing protein [Clostridiales bacterium]